MNRTDIDARALRSAAVLGRSCIRTPEGVNRFNGQSSENIPAPEDGRTPPLRLSDASILS
jgi:hypothetical protein